jgi:hypothetical protein
VVQDYFRHRVYQIIHAGILSPFADCIFEFTCQRRLFQAPLQCHLKQKIREFIEFRYLFYFLNFLDTLYSDSFTRMFFVTWITFTLRALFFPLGCWVQIELQFIFSMWKKSKCSAYAACPQLFGVLPCQPNLDSF